MSVAYDVITISVIALFAVLGYKRGFLKTVLSLVSVGVALLLSFVLAQPLAEFTYDKLFYERVVSSVEDKISSEDTSEFIRSKLEEQLGFKLTDAEITQISLSGKKLNDDLLDISKQRKTNITEKEIESRLDVFISRETLTRILGNTVPKSIVDKAVETLEESRDSLHIVVKASLNDNKRAGAEVIEHELLRGKFTSMIKVVTFIAVFIVTFIVMKLLIMIATIVNIIPGAKNLNQKLGLLLGFAEGIIVMFVIAAAVSLSIKLTNGDSRFFTEDYVNSTKIFKIFYR